MKCDCEPTVYADGSVKHQDECNVCPWCPHEAIAYICLMPCGCHCARCTELSAAHSVVRPEETPDDH